MELVIFFVGLLVSMTVVYGIFSQVPMEIAAAEEEARVRATGHEVE